MSDYKVQLLGYGPFDLPKKDKWLIVGSGPSYGETAFPDRKEWGVISLNSVQSSLVLSTVCILSHFEDVIQSWQTLDCADLVYIANPIHTGYRCIPMDVHSMFNYDDFVRYLPNKVRFFEKEESMNGFNERSHTLFCKHTIASAALSLLYRNGIKEVWTTGIDGGRGHAGRLSFVREYDDSRLITTDYDKAYDEFTKTAKTLGITLNKLEESHAMLQAG